MNQVGGIELLPGGSLTTMALGNAMSMVTHTAQVYFTVGFLSPCPDVPAQEKQLQHLAALPLTAGLGKNNIVRGWDCQCCQTLLEMLPYPAASSCLCAIFSDFPMTNLCLSDHLTLETDCNGNTFTSAYSPSLKPAQFV